MKGFKVSEMEWKTASGQLPGRKRQRWEFVEEHESRGKFRKRGGSQQDSQSATDRSRIRKKKEREKSWDGMQYCVRESNQRDGGHHSPGR